MKKLTISILLSILFITLNPNILQASHFAGGEITYTCLGGNSYQVTYTLYRDCSGVEAPNYVTTYFYCQTNVSVGFYTNLYKVPGTGQELTSICSLTTSACDTGISGNIGIQEYVYQATVFMAPCSSWNIYSTSCCRNSVSTISLNDQNSWYSSAFLNNINAPGNSSPKFNQKPQFIIFNGESTTLDMSATDVDGDSLVYSLEAPLAQTLYDSITYIPPWSKTNFLTVQSPQGITINPNTGQISFTAVQNLTSAFLVKVKEYRSINGIPTCIGSISRDVQIAVISGVNHLPVLSGINTDAAGSYNPNDTTFSLKICDVNTNINFNIYGYDADTLNPANAYHNELFNISWDSNIANATFTPHYNGTDSAYASFSWTPSSNDTNKIRQFRVKISDESCPYNGYRTYIYSFNFKKENNVSIGSDTSLCIGDVFTVNANTNYSPNSFAWTIDGNPLGNPPSQNSFIFNSANYSLGIHSIKVQDLNAPSSSNCSADSIDIDVLYQPQINGTFPDTNICYGTMTHLDAGQGTKYYWYNSIGILLDSSQIYSSSTLGGTYRLIVDGGTNMQCYDVDTFTVTSIPAPPAFNLGNDTTIAPNASIVLSIPNIGSPNYNWSTGATSQSITIDNSYNWINKIIGMADYGNQCVTSDTIYVYIGSVGINENEDTPLKIYPNPVQQSLNIELMNAYDHSFVEIFDMNGKLLIKTQFSGKSTELKSVNTLAKGNYILRLQNKELNILLRFVKE